MQPHPDFAGATIPREADLGLCHLTPLTAAQTDEDFAAVTASAHVLCEVFGDWPAGLTLEDNRVDLAWHDREFTALRSFSWIIRDTDGGYLGCLYVFPDPGRLGHAEAVIWLRAMPDRVVMAKALFPVLKVWVEQQIPQGVALRWQTSPAV